MREGRRMFLAKAASSLIVAAGGVALGANIALADGYTPRPPDELLNKKAALIEAMPLPPALQGQPPMDENWMDRPLIVPSEQGIDVPDHQLWLPNGGTTRISENPGRAEREPVTMQLPILTYHEVPPSFGQYIQENYLNKGYVAINARTMLSLLMGEKIDFKGKQPFVISFDDTLLSQKVNAVPFLVANGIPALFAVMPDWNGDGGHHQYMIKNDDIKWLANLGFDIVSHTFHHPQSLTWLRQNNRGSWESQIVGSKKRLEELIGAQVLGFCYPYGDGINDKETLELVARVYNFALSTVRGTEQRTELLPILRRDPRT